MITDNIELCKNFDEKYMRNGRLGKAQILKLKKIFFDFGKAI
jgi:hypothetical protein